MAQGRSTQIISVMKWIQTSRLPIQDSLSLKFHAPALSGTGAASPIGTAAGGAGEGGACAASRRGYLSHKKHLPHGTLE